MICSSRKIDKQIVMMKWSVLMLMLCSIWSETGVCAPLISRINAHVAHQRRGAETMSSPLGMSLSIDGSAPCSTLAPCPLDGRRPRPLIQEQLLGFMHISSFTEQPFLSSAHTHSSCTGIITQINQSANSEQHITDRSSCTFFFFAATSSLPFPPPRSHTSPLSSNTKCSSRWFWGSTTAERGRGPPGEHTHTASVYEWTRQSPIPRQLQLTERGHTQWVIESKRRDKEQGPRNRGRKRRRHQTCNCMFYGLFFPFLVKGGSETGNQIKPVTQPILHLKQPTMMKAELYSFSYNTFI